MSDKRFVYHIIAEIVVAIGIVGFFFRKTSGLESRIASLEQQVAVLTAQFSTLVAEVNVAVQGRNECVQQVCPIPVSQTQPEQCRSVDSVVEIPEIPFDEMMSRVSPLQLSGTDRSLDLDRELADEIAELDSEDRSDVEGTDDVV